MAPRLASILALVIMRRLLELTLVFSLFSKILIDIMTLFITIIVLNLAQVYLNLFALLDYTSIDINGQSIGVLTLASSIARQEILLNCSTQS